MSLGSRLSDADICRERGWAVGTVLEGGDGLGSDRIVITAIGETSVLARRVDEPPSGEDLWMLSFRDWHPVAEAGERLGSGVASGG